MSAPRLTVGLPFHNEERYLAAAIASVLRQSERDFELILVDDGSTDRSLEIARSFDDPRIVLVSDGRRRHLAARLNEITRRARGELVARMDGDDIAHPERFAREQAVLSSSDEISVVGTWVGLIDENDRMFGVAEAPLPATPATALERGILPHATIIARRSWMLANPYEESFSRVEDRELWSRTVSTTRFAVVPEPLYLVRVHPRSDDFLADYLESQRQNRILFRLYGPETYGWSRTSRALAISHLKGLVMRAAAATGADTRLVRRRGRPPTSHERKIVQTALDAARATSAR